MEKLFTRLANGWVVIASFVATAACLYLFSGIAAQLTALSSVPFTILDIMPTGLDLTLPYDFDIVNRAFAAYGEEGRALYVRTSLILDTLFPLAYGTLFASLLMRYRLHRLVYWVVWLVIIGVLVDFAENLQISNMLINYPDITAAMVERTALASKIKTLTLRTAQYFAMAQLAIAFARWCAADLKKI